MYYHPQSCSWGEYYNIKKYNQIRTSFSTHEYYQRTQNISITRLFLIKLMLFNQYINQNFFVFCMKRNTEI